MKARTRAGRYPLDTTVNRYCALYRRLIADAPRAASLQEACA
jgi:hypothetical protein